MKTIEKYRRYDERLKNILIEINDLVREGKEDPSRSDYVFFLRCLYGVVSSGLAKASLWDEGYKQHYQNALEGKLNEEELNKIKLK